MLIQTKETLPWVPYYKSIEKRIELSAHQYYHLIAMMLQEKLMLKFWALANLLSQRF